MVLQVYSALRETAPVSVSSALPYFPTVGWCNYDALASQQGQVSHDDCAHHVVEAATAGLAHGLGHHAVQRDRGAEHAMQPAIQVRVARVCTKAGGVRRGGEEGGGAHSEVYDPHARLPGH